MKRLGDYDLTLHFALMERETKGEYVLPLDNPVTWKRFEIDVDEFASRIAAKAAPDRENIFAELGILPAVSEQLQTHLMKIHKASLEVSKTTEQLLTARMDFDNKLHSFLSDGDYSRYRQYEENAPVRREYEKLEKFSQQQNTPMNPGATETILSLIRESKAFTEKSWYGPFDGLPEIGVGQEMTVGILDRRFADLKNNVESLRQKAHEMNLSEAEQNLLNQYYSDRLDTREKELASMKVPLREQRERHLREMENLGRKTGPHPPTSPYE